MDTPTYNSDDRKIMNSDNNVVDHIIQHKTMKSARDLNSFFDSNIDFITPKGCAETNVINLYKKQTYNIPSARMVEFFGLHESARRDNCVLNWQEKQNANSSGIMLDFDIYQQCSVRCVTERHFIKLASAVIKLLHEYIEFAPADNSAPNAMFIPRGEAEEFRIRAFFIQKPSLALVSDDRFSGKTSAQVYKDGFHMLIPEVQISRGLKRYLVRELVEKKMLSVIFSDIDKTLQSPEEMIDVMSTCVNVCYYGSSKVAKPAYTLSYAIDITLDAASGDCVTVPILLETLIGLNLTYELSLSSSHADIFSPDSKTLQKTWLRKRHFNYKKALESRIQHMVERNQVLDNPISRAEIATNDDELSILSLHDPDVALLQKVLLLLDPTFAREYDKWRNVVFAIANTSHNYKPLAIWFSQRDSKKWNPVDFDTMWNSAITTNAAAHPVTKRSIFYWASQCDPQKFKEIVGQSYHQVLYQHCAKFEGVIEQGIVSDLLFNMLGNKFVVDCVQSSTARDQYAWFEFVVPGQSMERGQIYKWRREVKPDVLIAYIQTHLPQLYQRIDDKIREKKTEATSEQLVKYWSRIEKTFKAYTTKLYNSSFKNGVIEQAKYKFRERGFIKRLDSYERIIGVANGVLDLGPQVRLIRGFHEYAISKSTTADYIPYDPNNPNVALLERAWNDTFVEPDAALFWKMYFSTFIQLNEVEQLLGMMVAGGSNAKTFWAELAAATLGEAYAVKVPIGLLTDDREKAQSANSALMSLEGKTFSRFSEPNGPEQLNTGRVKELYGGEKQSGRGLHKDQANFTMTATPLILSNYDFTVSVSDHGLWRRMRYYVPKVTFKKNPDPNNKFERQEDERFVKVYKNDPAMQSAFLSMLVHWNQILHTKYGGNLKDVPCPTISRETNEWRNRQDSINKFISQMVVVAAPGIVVPSYPMSHIAAKYIEWYNLNVQNIKTHNISVIGSKLENSAIGKFLVRQPDGSLILTKLRIKETVTEPPRDGETPMFMYNTPEPVVSEAVEVPPPIEIVDSFVVPKQKITSAPEDQFEAELKKVSIAEKVVPQGVPENYGSFAPKARIAEPQNNIAAPNMGLTAAEQNNLAQLLQGLV